MNFKESVIRELHVAKYGQTWRFRAVKYAILVPAFFAVYYFYGLKTMGLTLAVLGVIALTLHAYLSIKTDRWTKDWGPYKRIRLETEI